MSLILTTILLFLKFNIYIIPTKIQLKIQFPLTINLCTIMINQSCHYLLIIKFPHHFSSIFVINITK